MQLDYIAGFFDADGSISLALKPVRRNGELFYRYQPRAVISQSNAEILEAMQLTLGYGTLKLKAKKGFEKRPHFNLTLDSRNAVRFARDFQDRCHLKGPQLKAVLTFYDQHIGKHVGGPHSEAAQRRAVISAAAEKVRADLVRLRSGAGPSVWAA